MESRDQLRSNMITTGTTTTAMYTISLSASIERRIENTTDRLPSECYRLLHNRVLPASEENAMVICDYITSLRSEVNPSDGHKKNILILLCKFSTFFNGRPFRDITRDDVISFLDSFRKIEAVDPLHKWIGTYNLYGTHLLRFFKWL